MQSASLAESGCLAQKLVVRCAENRAAAPAHIPLTALSKSERLQNSQSRAIPPNPWQAAGGPEQYEHQSLWKAAEIVGLRRNRGLLEYRLTWEGYDQSFDTWEPEWNVLDKRLINNFCVSVDVNIDLQQPLYELRKEVEKQLMKIKRPQANLEVTVSLAALPPVARALLRLATRPPSRRGLEPLKVEISSNTRGMTAQLQLDEPEDHRRPLTR